MSKEFVKGWKGKTLSGEDCEIIWVKKGPCEYPIVAVVDYRTGMKDTVMQFTASGKFSRERTTHPLDLVSNIKPHPAESWPIDKPLRVKQREVDEWTCRHFSHYADGLVYCFDGGTTSWTVPYGIHGGRRISDWKFYREVAETETKEACKQTDEGEK